VTNLQSGVLCAKKNKHSFFDNARITKSFKIVLDGVRKLAYNFKREIFSISQDTVVT